MMKKYLFILVSVGEVLLGVLFLAGVTHAQFIDVQKDSLTYMYRHGIIDGYSDGTFRPAGKINRAELLKIIMNASNKDLSATTSPCFPDVAVNTWYAPYVCMAKQQGWVSGYPDGTFKPEQNVTKVEALKIIAAVQGWQVASICQSTTTIHYKDLAKCSWYYNYVVLAGEGFFVDPATYFYPARAITRGEVAEILFRTIIAGKTIPLADLVDPTKSQLAAAARDFFKIENVALAITYDDAVLADTYAQQNPELSGFDQNQKDPSGKYIAKPLYKTRKVMMTGSDGFTYAALPLTIQGGLETDMCPTFCLDVQLIAKFDQNNKLVAFDWIGFRPGTHYSVEFNLLSADKGKVTVETWSIDPDPGVGLHVNGTTTYVLKDLR